MKMLWPLTLTCGTFWTENKKTSDYIGRDESQTLQVNFVKAMSGLGRQLPLVGRHVSGPS